MHGLGNDFVVIDAINQAVAFTREQIQHLANRRFGVGCDQVLLVERPQSTEADFRYRIFNADGGEVEQCGNGARCFARFVHENRMTDKNRIVVETLSGVIELQLQSNGWVMVNMGMPVFEPKDIPFLADKRELDYCLEVDGEMVSASVLSMGNPHAVQLVEDTDTAPVLTQGPLIESHKRFPQRANAVYMKVIDKGHMKVRVYERGVGETLACGSGACAAVVAGRQKGLLDAKVIVDLSGGKLEIRWDGPGSPVWLTGPTATVFTGSISLNYL